VDVLKKNQSHRPHALGNFVARYGLVGFLILLIVFFWIMEPSSFMNLNQFKSLLLDQTVNACLAFSVLGTLIVGEFDLSVGYVVGFASVVAASVSGQHHFGTLVTILATLGAGLIVGLVNGFLTTSFRISSLIVTLGIGLAVSGLTVGVSGSQTLAVGIPVLITEMSTNTFLGIDSAVWICAMMAILLYLMLAHTPLGRRMYAVGGSERVATLAGIHTRRLKVLAFAGGGLLAAIAGILVLGQAGAANPSYGPSLLLPAYAAVFLGSTCIRPGYFNLWGTIVAVLVLAVGFTGLSLMGLPFWSEPIFNGGALIIGVLLSRSESRHAGGG
jgi:ribose transport system permease protein